MRIREADHIDQLIPTIDTNFLVLGQNVAKFDEIETKELISKPNNITICEIRIIRRFFEFFNVKTYRKVNDYQLYYGSYLYLINPQRIKAALTHLK